MNNSPTKQQKVLALSSEISLQLEDLTLELDERIKNLKILTKELTNSL